MTSLLNLVNGGGVACMHVVLFSFAATTEPHVVTVCCADFVRLKTTCLRDGKTYIQSIRAGRDMSIEGKTGGMTHAFIVRFASRDDRDYYIRSDPIHAKFAQGLVGVAASQVVDFMDGEY